MDGIASEQAVIGACLRDNEAYWKIASILRPTDFTLKLHQDIYTAIEVASNNGDSFDVITLSEHGNFDLANLMEIVNNSPGSANVAIYARQVRDASIRRETQALIAQHSDRIQSGDNDAIVDLAAKLSTVQRTSSNESSMQDAIRGALQRIGEAREKVQAGGMIGAPTGVPVIDERTGGLSGGKLIILAARPSLGKTALALQAAQAAADSGYPTGILSLEMGADEIAVRVLAHQYQVNNTALELGHGDTIESLTQKVAGDAEKMHRLNQLPVYIDDDTFDLRGMLARIVEWHRKHAIKFVIVDHLQLVEIPEGKNRNDGLGEITRALKLMAKRLGIPIMVLCQLGRSVEKESRPPRLSDLRDSGNIEQDADIVIALNGDLEAVNGCRYVETNFLKYRGGLVGWAGSMVFNGATQTFRRPAPEMQP